MNGKWKAGLRGVFLLALAAAPQRTLAQENAPPGGLMPATTRALGTITAISGQTITVKTDSGAELIVVVQDSTKFQQLKPGQTSLKDATPLTLADLKTGDRVLVRGASGSDGKSVQAT